MSAHKTGYRPSCKVCDRAGINKDARHAYEKQYWSGDKAREKKSRIKRGRERNLESYNAVQRAYRQTEDFKRRHREHAATRRARMLSAFVETVNYAQFYAESSKVCAYCAKPLRFEDVEFDHFIPISKGGKHERTNIRISCVTCNRSKAAKIPGEVRHQVD